jgi:hypothetical protein
LEHLLTGGDRPVIGGHELDRPVGVGDEAIAKGGLHVLVDLVEANSWWCECDGVRWCECDGVGGDSVMV